MGPEVMNTRYSTFSSRVLSALVDRKRHGHWSLVRLETPALGWSNPALDFRDAGHHWHVEGPRGHWPITRGAEWPSN